MKWNTLAKHHEPADAPKCDIQVPQEPPKCDTKVPQEHFQSEPQNISVDFVTMQTVDGQNHLQFYAVPSVPNMEEAQTYPMDTQQ